MMEATNENASLWSLPDELIESCVARISKCYYPTLSLVSKRFRSLILSIRLHRMRSYVGAKEDCVFVCLKLPDHSSPSWFSLWIKKTQQTQTMDKQNSTGNLLVPIPSSYTPRLPHLVVTVGSEVYKIGGRDSSSSRMWLIRTGTVRHKAPRITVPRARATNALAVALHGQIYVMGGCNEDESTNWGEVFDTKTQTWEPLPDPGKELRSCLIAGARASRGKLRVKVSEKEHITKRYIYDPEKGRWDKITRSRPKQRVCRIENVKYSLDHKYCYWFDTELVKWRQVKGLDILHGYVMAEMTHHAGKLLIFFWEQSSDPNKKLWCALITLERRHGGQVWGQIEWTDVVLTVPQPSTFIRCVHQRV